MTENELEEAAIVDARSSIGSLSEEELAEERAKLAEAFKQASNFVAEHDRKQRIHHARCLRECANEPFNW